MKLFVTKRKAGKLPNKNLAFDIFLCHYISGGNTEIRDR